MNIIVFSVRSEYHLQHIMFIINCGIKRRIVKVVLAPKLFIAILIYLTTVVFAFSQGYIMIDKGNGLPIASDGQKAIIQSNYVYFGIEPSGKWTWAGQRNRFEIISDFNYALSGDNRVFGYTYHGSVSKIDEHSFRYEIDFDNNEAIEKVIGGGIEFKLNAEYNEIYGTPRLLENNTGWIWGNENGEHFKLEFTDPVADVFFERRNPNVIRVYFFRDRIEVSKHNHQAIFSGPDDFTLRQTNDELFGLYDIDEWFEIDAPFYTAADLSFLNHLPAGKHGFLETDGDALVFEDGTKAKFWGTTVSANALFSTRYEDIDNHAKRIAALGFNLVRLTHHDARWVRPNVFGEDAQTTNRISEDQMRVIDKWVAELNAVGIYIWFDFHHERYLLENDNIYGFEEIERKSPNAKGTADLRGYSHFNDSIRLTMQSLNKQLITRVNKETNERYADNKGIIFLLLTNENDITHHFGNRLLKAQKVPMHTELLDKAVDGFSRKNNLPANRVGQTWIPGPSKLFLNDAEHNFNQKLLSSLREDDSNHLVVTTSSWGDNPMYSLPALTESAVIDVHTYGEVGELEVDPNKAANFLHWIAAAHVADKPLSVSEWNVETFPVPDRHASSLYMAAVASHQGWDAMMQFNYATRSPTGRGQFNPYSMYHDPAMLGTMQAAALMYRQGHLQEAVKTYVFAPSAEELMYTALTPKSAKILRTVPEKSKLLIKLPKMENLPWLQETSVPADAKIITKSDFSLVDEGDSSATTDTGELYRNWQEGIYTINSAKSKAVMGWIGGRHIELDSAVFDIKTNSASIIVQTLDNQDINNSQNIMISFAARAEPRSGRRAPIFAEPVTGMIKIYADSGLKLYKHKNGDNYTELGVTYQDGAYNIELARDLKTYWLFLRK